MSFIVIAAFVQGTFLPTRAYAQSVVSPSAMAPNAMIGLTNAYTPVLVRAIEIDPQNPLQFGFIVDNGDTKLKGDALTQETKKLIRYFLASLTVPEKDMWVNLSPYEKDRIVPESFGNTEMGRDLLAQDYILKQLTASLIYPEDELGKKFWERVYKKAYETYGTTQIPVNTFNKVWIVPEKASVYEHGNRVFVIDSQLNVMMEEDFLALQESGKPSAVSDKQQQPKAYSLQLKAHNNSDSPTSALTSSIVREIILPEIKKEVNFGKNFANLRQIYNAMILATWYKKNLKDSLLGKVYVDQNKIKGIELEAGVKGQRIKGFKENLTNSTTSNPQILKSSDPLTVDEIYDQYLAAFKKGAYNFIKVEHDQYTNKNIPRKYFSGGFSNLEMSSRILTKVTDPSPLAFVKTGDDTELYKIGVNKIQNDQSATAGSILTSEELRDDVVSIVEQFNPEMEGVAVSEVQLIGKDGTPE
ncbi:MAG: hypothetical protein NT079_06835 [Candidatus Omnitrophica bacterium]|nr:hypothetical protein [Candidatus Omnitrophota bacterium]